MLLFFTSWGCSRTEEKEKTKLPTLAAKDRPALKVVLVNATFAKEIELQWKAFSEQAIQVDSISIEEAQNRPLDSTDVWLFPGDLIGDFVDREIISPLPLHSYGKAPEAEIDQNSDARMETWPARWRGVARFGGSVFAMPLGAKPLAIVANEVSLDPLVKAEASNRPSDDLTANAIAVWDETIQPNAGEVTTEFSLDEQQKSWLVDRFLFIASTTNARYRGLFDLSKLTPKIDSSDFLESVRILVALAKSNPELLKQSPTQAWQSVVEGKGPAMAIGMPSSVGAISPEEAQLSAKVGALVWNPNESLLVAVGKKTRQSSVASQFVAWLSEPDQRAAFAKLDGRIELWPSQADSNVVRQDYRSYLTLCNRDQRPEPMTLTLRFRGARKYRQRLGDALAEVLNSPDKAKAIMVKCLDDWTVLNEQLDVSKQRRSVEQSLGYTP